MGAPSNPGWKYGYVPSPGEWNNTFGSKADYPVPVSQGGTGQLTPPEDGQILIGADGNYTLNTLTAGSGITINVDPGEITISASGPLSGSFIFGEVPSGDIDGSNSTYTLANTPIGSIALYRNGIRAAASEYSVSGATITTSTPLDNGENIIVDYIT